MTERQPSMREARESVEIIKLVLDLCSKGEGFVTSHHENGFWVRWKGSRYDNEYLYPFSDVTEKCEICGRVLRDGYYRYLTLLYDDRARTDIRLVGFVTDKSKIVCLSCYNKWSPLETSLRQACLTEFQIRKTRREIYDAKIRNDNVR